MEESIMHPELGVPGMPPGLMLPPGMTPPPGMFPPGIGAPPGMKPPPGMQGMLPPGADPMAMLQFQQLNAQMSAMQAQMSGAQKGKK